MTIESFVEKKDETKKDASREDELTLTLQRVQADFDNYRKRMQGELTTQHARGKAAALKDMLAFADTLDAAAKNKNGPSENGIEALRVQFQKILAENGVNAFDVVGKPFDPFTCECMQNGNDSSKPDDSVLEEFQKGYLFHSDVLRTAKVKVNKITSNQSEISKENTTTGGTNHE